MKIEELIQHEQGILNLLERETPTSLILTDEDVRIISWYSICLVLKYIQRREKAKLLWEKGACGSVPEEMERGLGAVFDFREETDV